MPPSPPRARTAFALAAALAAAGCKGAASGPSLPTVDLGPSLAASPTDPLLLTFAASRDRAQYLPDQGYTLAWDARDVPAFTTQLAGDLGLVLEVDGILYIAQTDLYTPMTVDHTASDAAVLSFQVDELLRGEIWFVVGSSTAATVDVRLFSTADYQREASVIVWLRRCDAPFESVASSGFGLAARHHVAPDPQLDGAGPGTFLTDFADALAGEETPVAVLGRASCGADAYDDAGVMVNQATPPPSTAAVLGVRFDRSIAPGASVDVHVHRAVVDAAHAGDLTSSLDAERKLSLPDVLVAGKQRMDPAVQLTAATGDAALVHRSAFALLDQLVMPPEGTLTHDYYLFSREPTFTDARLGQGVHESLAMLLLARADPQLAVETQRNFIDAIPFGGFLTSRIGPVAPATPDPAAAPPLFSYESLEISRSANDPSFLADAYAAGQTLHGFWTSQRDTGQNGLSEWGSLAESLRGTGSAVYRDVAPPEALEEVDLNCMLVMEEKSLSAMATALGKAGDAAMWQDAADARAARINAVMWDDATGFYYNVTRDKETFDYAKPGDLKRMEISGFLPLWAGIVPYDRLSPLLAHLSDPSAFLRTYGLATLSAQDPAYAPRVSGCCGWNGPVSVPWTYLVVRGLLDAGQGPLASQITQSVVAGVSAQLTRTHQFRSAYDPDRRDAENAGLPNYVWSSMAALMLLDAGPQ
jgi:hypothetical protein